MLKGPERIGKGVTLLAVVVATSACAGVSSPTDQASQPDSSPSPSLSPSPSSASASERPALDLWDNFGAPEGHEVGRYDSLGAMLRGANIVVEATVAGVDGSEIYEEDDPETALRGIRITLDVREVYKGDLEVGDAVPVIVGLAELAEDVETKFADLVGDAGIFFLMPGGAPQPEFGIEEVPSEQRTGNWRPVSSQGIVIDDRGTAVFTINIVGNGFPASLDGMPYGEMRSRVKAA